VVPPTQAKPVSATPAAVSAVVPQKPVEVKPEPGMVPLPALQEERTKRQQLESEVAELRRMVTGNQYQQQQQQPQVDPRKELDQLWEQDPRKAVQVEIMYAMDWRDRIDSSLDIQADQLAQRFPDFNNYRSTTLGYVRNLPLNQRGTQGILEAAYFMVRGQNADTMLQQREADLLERYRRGEIGAAALGTPSGAFSSPTLNPGIQLTPEQHSVADAMGMTDAQYAANIKTTQGGR
jgi:hypothetical protein